METVGFVEEDVIELAEVTLLLLVSDFEKPGLCLIGKLTGTCFAFTDPGFDVLGGQKQPTQMRCLLDDLGVMTGVARGRNLLGQFRDVVVAARFLEPSRADQRLGDGQRITGLVRGVQVKHHLEDRLVAVEVKIGRVQLDFIDGPVDGGLIDQHRAEDCLLGVDVVGWYLGYFSSATIVLTEAIAPPATSTSIM